MNVRQYEPADLPRVIETYTASIRSLAVPYYSEKQIAAWAPDVSDPERWQHRLAGLNTIVAEWDGRFAGFASYTNEGYLDFLFTHPAFARRGVASCLCLRVEVALRALAVARITTHSSLAARLFFARQGFVADAEECVECRGVFLQRIAMHKQLADAVTNR